MNAGSQFHSAQISNLFELTLTTNTNKGPPLQKVESMANMNKKLRISNGSGAKFMHA